MNWRRLKNLVLKALVLLFGAGILLCCAVLVLYVLIRGFASLNMDMLLSEPSLLFGTSGVLPAIVNTVLMMVVVAGVAFPLGVLASLFLSYIKSEKLKTVLRYFMEVVCSLPPVVFALLGMLVFCQWFGLRVSVLAGALTMAVILFTEVMSSSEQNLGIVAWQRRQQAQALGASHGRLIFTIILPESLPMIAAGFFRSMARVAAETIALLLTVGAGTQLAESFGGTFAQSGGTLAVMLYVYVQQRGDYSIGFAMAALLLVLIGFCIFASNASQQYLIRRLYK